MKWYIADFNGILTDLQLKVGPLNLANPRDADTWVIWQDVLGSFGDLVKASKYTEFNKPIFTVQHGRGATSDYDKPNNLPFSSDYYLCWGTSDYNRMVKLGYGDRTHIVGCPLNSHIKPKVPHSEKVILFVPVNSGKEEPENISTYYELLKLKYDKASSKVRILNAHLKDKWDMTTNKACEQFDVVTKLLPWHDKSMYHGRVLLGQQNTFRNNQLIFELLRNVDMVVGLDEGCTEAFAMAHDVPVVVVNGFKYRQHKEDGRRYEEVEINKTKGAVHCNLEDLKEVIEHGLAHPEYLRQERKDVAEAEMGLSHGDATNNIYKFIRSKVKDLVKA